MSTETKWHQLFTIQDVAQSHGVSKGQSHYAFYNNLLNTGCKKMAVNHAINPTMSRHQAGGGSELTQYVSEYVYLKMGRPLWFVDLDMADMLMRCKIECNDLSTIHLPYDTFGLSFEKGLEIYGYPLRTIMFCVYKSKLSQKIASELVPDMDFQEDMIKLYFDFGENAQTKQCSQDTNPLNLTHWHWFRKFVEPDVKGDTLEEEVQNLKTIYKESFLSDKEWSASLVATKIMTAALFYYNARPDLVVPYALPRSIRYSYKGDRDNFRRLKLPLTKKVYPKSSEMDYTTGRTVKAHTRGFVLRHLRDEKYKRNVDGSIRTVLVEPCVIHPEEWEKENGKA